MTKEVSARLDLLTGMNIYIRDILGDDDLIDIWNQEGIPDECDINMMIEIAESKNSFDNIVAVFNHIINN